MDDVLALSLTQLKIFEGEIPWLYLDSKGNVTVGVGLMLPNLAAAQALPLYVDGQAGPSLATGSEIVMDWTRLQALGKGRVATAYRAATSCFLQQVDIDGQLLRVVSALNLHMPALYPNYAEWPTPAKVAVLDMGYNLGAHGLAVYHDMNAALNATPPNFLGAKAQCLRDADQSAFATRNTWTQEQFAAAAASE
jgi:hypothetical protein